MKLKDQFAGQFAIISAKEVMFSSALVSLFDKQRLAAFIGRSIRQGFCAPDFANFSDIIDAC